MMINVTEYGLVESRQVLFFTTYIQWNLLNATSLGTD